MPYRYMEDIAIADAAFEAWGHSVEEMLMAAAEAALCVMISNPACIGDSVVRKFRIEEPELDMLLLQLLQELIYYKDAESLLLRVRSLRAEKEPDRWTASIEACGEPIDPEKHELATDVKAVTLHRLKVEQSDKGWSATVVLDT
jgi:SHS2 domain-containing protein